MARPATVISNASTTSSPLPVEFKISKDEMRSKSKPMMVTPEDLPLPEDMDWPSLVDTATRVMQQVGSDSNDKNRQEELVADASIASV